MICFYCGHDEDKCQCELNAVHGSPYQPYEDAWMPRRELEDLIYELEEAEAQVKSLKTQIQNIRKRH